MTFQWGEPRTKCWLNSEQLSMIVPLKQCEALIESHLVSISRVLDCRVSHST